MPNRGRAPRGRYQEAKPLYCQVREICRQVLGEQRPDFADSLYGLASLYLVTGG